MTDVKDKLICTISVNNNYYILVLVSKNYRKHLKNFFGKIKNSFEG